VESAALLHDIDKLELVRPETAGLAHAVGSAEWLGRRGYPELGPVIVGHPVTRLADAVWFDSWMETATPEALIVAYADKRAGQRLESMAAERAGRPRGSWTAETIADVRRRAEEIERRVCLLAAVEPATVRRLRWTSRAMEAARRAVVAGARPLATSPAAATVPDPRPR
jgi:HD superfamily phosphodiesterase